MNNVFNTTNKIDRRYDLKGSTRGRTTFFPEGEPRDYTIAMKDNDFLNDRMKLKVDRETKKRLLEAIKKDVEFFARCEINDYSLLVGVHERKKH